MREGHAIVRHRYKGGEPMDVQVHAYGDMAVQLRGRSGLGASCSARFTDVFARRGGRWLLWRTDAYPKARR